MRKFKIAHQEKGKVIEIFCLVFAIKHRDFWWGFLYKTSARLTNHKRSEVEGEPTIKLLN
jgi:hypothetical protein